MPLSRIARSVAYRRNVAVLPVSVDMAETSSAHASLIHAVGYEVPRRFPRGKRQEERTRRSLRLEFDDERIVGRNTLNRQAKNLERSIAAFYSIGPHLPAS